MYRRYNAPPNATSCGSRPVKKGRHRRFEEARALKRNSDLDLAAIFDSESAEPCPECGAEPGDEHASWCLFEADDDEHDSAL
jgi:hypothetical protein